MKISVIKSAHEVAIGSVKVTNKSVADFMIRLNDLKNNLKKRRYTHWVKVGFEKEGFVEFGNGPMCMGDYDEYPITSEVKLLIPIEDDNEVHKQYICNVLATPIVLQSKPLTQNEEIIIAYTELEEESGNSNAINSMLLEAMKKNLFEYQMKTYTIYQDEGIDKDIFNKRIKQIIGVLSILEELLEKEKAGTDVAYYKKQVSELEHNKPKEFEQCNQREEVQTLKETKALEEKNSLNELKELNGLEELEKLTELRDLKELEELRKIEIIKEDDHQTLAEPIREQAYEDDDVTENLGDIITHLDNCMQHEEDESIRWIPL